MKQILMTALTAVAVLLSSCSKDDNGNGTDPTSPITGLEMPASSAEQPVSAGATVSIKGVGFTASDEIWFAAAVKASGEVKAEGVVATATGLSFIAPAIDGEASVTLKQAGKSYPLGKMFFATKGENPLTEHVYTVKETDAGCEFFEYDLDKGTFKSVFKVPVYTMGVVADNRSNIYYLAYELDGRDMFLSYYNLNEKKEVRLISKLGMDNTSIGMIDNKLHMIRYDETKGYDLVSIDDDGKETLVKSFGQLPDPNYIFYGGEMAQFIYDATSKSIVLAGSSEYDDGGDGSRKVTYTIISFSMETGTITTKHRPDSEPNSNTSTWFNLAQTNTGILSFTIQNTWSTTSADADTEVGKTIIDYIDPVTLVKKSEVATIDYEFDKPVYVAGKNMLLGIDSRKYEPSILLSYDLTAKSLKQVSGGEDCGYLFTMFY